MKSCIERLLGPARDWGFLAWPVMACGAWAAFFLALAAVGLAAALGAKP